MGWGLSSLIPKNTILGKALSGDFKGAASSAVNYVKSGELATDFKNISTQNYGAIANKAITGYQGNGNLIKGILDNGTNITSLKPTPIQEKKAENIQAQANVALAIGSGVPVNQALKIQQPTQAPMAQEGVTPLAYGTGSNQQSDKGFSPLLLVGVGIGAYLLLGKKRRTSYRRKAVSRMRTYARRTYGRAMSYRKRKY